ncbi:hypothetical protein Fcan01_05114 [Folsomia candida]|uniref:Uncharacterized protein n=2 Tax=Folsomia candida TaxID=158441 RepID=A0A226EPY9_FOLCA|nr:hypothetical protein Fcan01_05114 [Folsomia candida]
MLASVLLVQDCSGVQQCFAPTACDTNLASCTIGLDCLGSLFTMCDFGDLQPNGACQTFPGTTTPYCECNSCIGLVNELFYSCSCNNAPSGLVCPTDTTFVSCRSFVTGQVQYSCCKSPDVC